MDGRSLPAEAFRFDVGIAMLADDRRADGARRRRFRGNAHSGRPMRHYLGNVAVDLASLRVPRQDLPVLRDHNPAAIVGYTETVSKSRDGIVVDGFVVGATEAGREVLALLEADVPLQMSVYVPPERVLRLAEGEEKVVNGHRVRGPGAVLYGSVLREVTVTALGADDTTRAAALAAGSAELVGGGCARFGAAHGGDAAIDEANRLADSGELGFEFDLERNQHVARARAAADQASRPDRWGCRPGERPYR